jgi:hypothetical protein
MNACAVLDLTAEFGEVGFCESAYLCIPLLDRTAPSFPQFERRLVLFESNCSEARFMCIARWVWKECNGVVAYLVATGKFANIDEAAHSNNGAA